MMNVRQALRSQLTRFRYKSFSLNNVFACLVSSFLMLILNAAIVLS
jgi:hypothetical protein